MNEIWKDVIGYEGLYEVSNLGCVRSVKKISKSNGKLIPYPERVLTQFEDKGGYLYVAVSKYGKQRKIKVHRIVAMSFCERPDGMDQVNHLDENKHNNKSDNLEWCDVRMNANHGTRNSRISLSKTGKCPNQKRVSQYTLDGSFVNSFYSTYDAQRKTGKSRVGIGRCCRGECKKYSGFIWKYE